MMDGRKERRDKWIEGTFKRVKEKKLGIRTTGDQGSTASVEGAGWEVGREGTLL